MSEQVGIAVGCKVLFHSLLTHVHRHIFSTFYFIDSRDFLLGPLGGLPWRERDLACLSFRFPAPIRFSRQFMHIDCSTSIDRPPKEMSSLCCPASVVPVQEGARCKSLARIQGIGVSVVCVDVHNAFPFGLNSSSDSGSHGTTHLPEDALFRGDPRRHHQFFSYCLLVAV